MEVLWEKDAESDKLYCNTIIFPDKSIIIDPSAGERRIREIKEKTGWRHCILTHYHGDHRASYYIAEPDITYIHEDDAPALRSVENFANMVGFLKDEIGKMMFEFVKIKYHLKDVENLVPLKDGEELNLEGVSFKVIHTPGHTPGHICLYIESEDTLYLSDIDLTDFGPWYGNVESDIDKFIKSIDRVSEIRAKKYLSAHKLKDTEISSLRERRKSSPPLKVDQKVLMNSHREELYTVKSRSTETPPFCFLKKSCLKNTLKG